MSTHRVDALRMRRWFLVALIAGLGVAAQPLTAAEQSRTASKAAANQTGEAGALDLVVEAKLDDILAHQEQILQRLDQVMEELKIVKIRATVR